MPTSETTAAQYRTGVICLVSATFFTSLAGVGSALIAAIIAPDLHISQHDLAITVFLGVVQLALQYVLIATATRYVPAAEVALIGRLTLIMAPLWVWIFVDEVPGALSLAGGVVILLAVTGQGVFALRRARRAAA
jgi:drug/metabolite transporter (DMT)-like permease